MKHFTAKNSVGFFQYFFHYFLALFVLFALTACGENEDKSSTSSTSTLTYNFTDKCDDNRQIEYRIFDVTNDKVWPSSSEVYSLSAFDRSFEKKIQCSTGADICYGGVSRVFGVLPLGSWGVGINNSTSCNDCCKKCESVTRNIDLTC